MIPRIEIKTKGVRFLRILVKDDRIFYTISFHIHHLSLVACTRYEEIYEKDELDYNRRDVGLGYDCVNRMRDKIIYSFTK